MTPEIRRIQCEATITQMRKNYFKFECPPNIPVLIHEIVISSGAVVGYVATEDFNYVAAPHIFVYPEYRTREYLTEVTQIFKEIYCPTMKAEGKQWLVTNCDKEDKGTTNFLAKCGFALKNIMVAEYTL